MKRPIKNGLIIVVVVLGVVGAGLGISFATSSYLASQKTECEDTGIEHIVRIKNNQVTPKHTDGKQCERLKIINEDNTNRLMAFGHHDRHVAYDGIAERYLSQNQSVEVTLVSTGDYLFHDHEDDNVFGTFSVTSD